jgi:hypothetical protein
MTFRLRYLCFLRVRNPVFFKNLGSARPGVRIFAVRLLLSANPAAPRDMFALSVFSVCSC